ncbi:hypothetical protein BFS86_19855 [Shewanella algae]|nr:hypothetical protein BFS86_19855 [Shewanella algae]DAQ47178.1 MAG TPA: hypothetical protein [Caudoviricetes sp.]
MYLCAHDDAGKILGWYTEDRLDEITGSYIEVDDETWRQASQVMYATHVDLVTKAFEHRGAVLTLDALKAGLKSQIDADAEIERLKYITTGAGQSMTYSQKSAEALAYLSASNPIASDYPLLSAEVGITAKDIAGVAAVVKAAYLQWQQIGSAIETTRLSAKKAITDAKDAAAAQAAVVNLTWPTPQ